jgi:hypothetical protein
VSADDEVAWGLTFDLARAVLFPEDAGIPKTRAVSLLTKSPVKERAPGSAGSAGPVRVNASVEVEVAQ